MALRPPCSCLKNIVPVAGDAIFLGLRRSAQSRANNGLSPVDLVRELRREGGTEKKSTPSCRPAIIRYDGQPAELMKTGRAQWRQLLALASFRQRVCD